MLNLLSKISWRKILKRKRHLTLAGAIALALAHHTTGPVVPPTNPEPPPSVSSNAPALP